MTANGTASAAVAELDGDRANDSPPVIKPSTRDEAPLWNRDSNEVSGVSVPDDVMERMRLASEKSKEHALVEGVTIARETLERVRGRVADVQVSAPLGRVDLALQVFEGLVEQRITAS